MINFNTLYLEDTLKILKQIPDNSLDMVYGDPDYNVGINYNGNKYTKSWDKYIEWYCELASESIRVLKPTGNLFLINYPKQNAYLRVKCLDNICYKVYDYVWIYNSNVGHSPSHLTTAHRSILHATKTKNNNFYKENIAVPYQNPTDKRIMQRIQNGSTGRMPYSWFYYDLVKNVSKDKTFHACQIPQKLVEMLILSCTQKNDTVFILFGGSGGEIIQCEQLSRTWISCELNQEYYQMIFDRLENTGDIKIEYKLQNKRNKYTSLDYINQ